MRPFLLSNGYIIIHFWMNWHYSQILLCHYKMTILSHSSKILFLNTFWVIFNLVCLGSFRFGLKNFDIGIIFSDCFLDLPWSKIRICNLFVINLHITRLAKSSRVMGSLRMITLRCLLQVATFDQIAIVAQEFCPMFQRIMLTYFKIFESFYHLLQLITRLIFEIC